MNLKIEQNNQLTEELGNKSASVIKKLYDIVKANPNTTELSGRIHGNTGYGNQIDYLNNSNLDFNKGFRVDVDNLYMIFEDSAVEDALKTTAGDGVGVIESMFQALTVVDMRENTDIVRFKEFKDAKARKFYFCNCKNLKVLGYPKSCVGSLGDGGAYGFGLEELHFEDFEYTLYNFNTTYATSSIAGSHYTPCKYYDNDGNEILDVYIEQDSRWNILFTTIENIQTKDGVSHFSIASNRYLKYLTIGEGVTSAPCPQSCSSLLQVIFPSTITTIPTNYRTFQYSGTDNCVLVIKAETPPTGGNIELKCKALYVPDNSVEAYKSASNFSNYSTKIYPISSWTDVRPDEYKHESV